MQLSSVWLVLQIIVYALDLNLNLSIIIYFKYLKKKNPNQVKNLHMYMRDVLCVREKGWRVFSHTDTRAGLIHPPIHDILAPRNIRRTVETEC